MAVKHRKALVLFGATLTISPLAVLTYYGNLLPYLASYLQARRDHIHLYLDPLWPTTVFRCCFSFSMIFSSPLEQRFGLHPCILAGIVLLKVSVFSGFFAVDEPLAFTLTFGVAHGSGAGFVYCLTLKLLLETMGKKGGTATGIMSIGPAVGSVVNIAIAFAVINPENKKADLEIDNRVYFSDPGVIRRVPYYFLAIGGFVSLATLVGFACMYVGSSQSEQDVVEEIPLVKNDFTQDSQDSSDDLGEAVPLKPNHEKVKVYEKLSTQDSSNGVVHDELPSAQSKTALLPTDHTDENSPRKSSQKKLLTPGGADLTPREMIRTRQFWCVWVCCISFSHAVYVHLNLYKQYGQIAISSDAILVTTGLICTLGMIVTRPLIGVVSDKIGPTNTCLAICASGSIIMCFMVVVIHVLPSLYPLVAIIEFQCLSAQVFIFSLLTSDLFGRTHCPSNLGLVCCGQPLVSLLEPFIVPVIVKYLSWHWMFLSGAFAAALSMMSIMALDWV